MTETKQPPRYTQLPKQLPGESDKAYEKRVMAWISGDDVRSKDDLRDWCPGVTWHFIRD